MREVAARAGVSAKTVSRVLRGEGYASEDARARVLAAVDELNYVPNLLAVTFRAGRDAAVGVAVPDIADPYFAEIVQAVESVARQRNIAVIVTSLGYDGSREQAAVETLLQRQVLGLIACPVSTDQSYLKSWLLRTPVVFVDRSPGRITADSVIEDDRGGAYEATTHLIGHGHRRVAFFGDPPTVTTTAKRLEGYLAALDDAGIPRDDDLVRAEVTDAGSAAEAVRGVGALSRPPTAIFSSNARCTLRLIPALANAAGPRLAVVSFGDFPLADALTPPVTVIDQNASALGAFAAERLFARIADPDKRMRRRTVLPVHLIERESCRLDI
ncbi:LacI family DNA-binding transcriptional regulator [Nostocoides veronense]|uniref:LacI family DNA-binding transcriptional regulator n=2 Tax=Nostocoides veronense TaxID=330836 RepID=A0ABN2LAT2_9MICO